MHPGRTIFTQLISLAPLYQFNQCVELYKGHKWVQTFTCWDQFLAMVYAQLTARRSLRDLEASLQAQRHKLYHMGFRSPVMRATLAKANQNRDWRIWRDFAQCLIEIARPLYADEDLGLDLDATIFALDSTTIDLCLPLFPWAQHRKHKSAVKIHTLLDLRGAIPVFLEVTSGAVHDIHILDHLWLPPGSFLVMDRGYRDLSRLYRLTQEAVYFVTRALENQQYRRRYSHPADATLGILCDQTIVLTGPKSSRLYPQPLRRVRYWDEETDRQWVFLTNNFLLPARTIADLYHNRWQIELFFKWIKQHLKIQVFLGTSPNAVKTQVWIAMATYLLVAIAKKKLNLSQSLYTIIQVLGVCACENVPILQLFSRDDYSLLLKPNPNQLSLLD
jgi:hypothetical protein